MIVQSGDDHQILDQQITYGDFVKDIFDGKNSRTTVKPQIIYIRWFIFLPIKYLGVEENRNWITQCNHFNNDVNVIWKMKNIFYLSFKS